MSGDKLSPAVKRERAAVVAFLRGGGETIRGTYYAWDSEMRGYAKSFAQRIEDGDHASIPSTEGRLA